MRALPKARNLGPGADRARSLEGGPMAKPNYSFEKRQRELAKKKKKEEKPREKADRKAGPGGGTEEANRARRRVVRHAGRQQRCDPEAPDQALARRCARREPRRVHGIHQARLHRDRRAADPGRQHPRTQSGPGDAARTQRGEHKQPGLAPRETRLIRADPASDGAGGASAHRHGADDRQPIAARPAPADAAAQVVRRRSTGRSISWPAFQIRLVVLPDRGVRHSAVRSHRRAPPPASGSR